VDTNLNVDLYTSIQLNERTYIDTKVMDIGLWFIFNFINEMNEDGQTVVGFLGLLVGDRPTAHT
jgi:hypothetical protein